MHVFCTPCNLWTRPSGTKLDSRQTLGRVVSAHDRIPHHLSCKRELFQKYSCACAESFNSRLSWFSKKRRHFFCESSIEPRSDRRYWGQYKRLCSLLIPCSAPVPVSFPSSPFYLAWMREQAVLGNGSTKSLLKETPTMKTITPLIPMSVGWPRLAPKRNTTRR